MITVLRQAPPEILAIFVTLIAALIALGWAMVTLLYGPQARLRRRLARVMGAQARDSVLSSAKADRDLRRRTVQARLKTMEQAETRERGYRLREQLSQAGLSLSLRAYLIGSGGLTVVVGGAVLLAGLGGLWAILAGLIAGLGLPRLLLGLLARRRVDRFVGQMADAIDIVVRGLRSGLPLGECIAIISREMADPLGGEFRAMVETQRLGMPLHDALARAVVRMPIAELRYFAIVIDIQQQTGGNLAETLAKLSEVLRARKRMRDKVQAYASEARSSAYIIGALPLVVILALGVMAPHYIAVLFTTPAGKALLFIGAMTEIAGLLVMRRMINFDI